MPPKFAWELNVFYPKSGWITEPHGYGMAPKYKSYRAARNMLKYCTSEFRDIIPGGFGRAIAWYIVRYPYDLDGVYYSDESVVVCESKNCHEYLGKHGSEYLEYIARWKPKEYAAYLAKFEEKA